MPKIARLAPLWAVLLIICNTLVLWQVIPPFQSPDEFDHLKRAYLLTRGVFILETPVGGRSGGMIDQGLLDYMHFYHHLPAHMTEKVTDTMTHDAKQIRWAHQESFSSASGTGYYFPLIYAPQSLALALGEWMDVSIATSYDLARLFVLISVSFLLWAAFTCYPVPPWVLATLFLPMTMFQCASASLDAMAIALSVFSMAAFLKVMCGRSSSHVMLFYAALITLSIVVSSRVNLFPLFVLPLYVAYAMRRVDAAVCTLAMVALNLWWAAVAAKTTVHGAIVLEQPVREIVIYYMTHLAALWDVLYATTTQIPGWGAGFIGVLGWLDTPFSIPVYILLVAGYVCIVYLSAFNGLFKKDLAIPLLLIVASGASVCITLAALLITFTPHPATMITGVQGRYFLIPVLMLAYAFSEQPDGRRYGAGVYFLVIIFNAVALLSTANLLIDRYY